MTASLRGLPACNTEACGLSRLKNHSALLVRFAPCGQHLRHKTRRGGHHPAILLEQFRDRDCH